MRTVIAAALVAASVLPSYAGEVSLKLDDATQNIIVQLPSVLEQCVSGLIVRGESQLCKNLNTVLVLLSNEAKAAQASAKQSPAEAAK